MLASGRLRGSRSGSGRRRAFTGSFVALRERKSVSHSSLLAHRAPVHRRSPSGPDGRAQVRRRWRHLECARFGACPASRNQTTLRRRRSASAVITASLCSRRASSTRSWYGVSAASGTNAKTRPRSLSACSRAGTSRSAGSAAAAASQTSRLLAGSTSGPDRAASNAAWARRTSAASSAAQRRSTRVCARSSRVATHESRQPIASSTDRDERDDLAGAHRTDSRSHRRLPVASVAR